MAGRHGELVGHDRKEVVPSEQAGALDFTEGRQRETAAGSRDSAGEFHWPDHYLVVMVWRFVL